MLPPKVKVLAIQRRVQIANQPMFMAIEKRMEPTLRDITEPNAMELKETITARRGITIPGLARRELKRQRFKKYE